MQKIKNNRELVAIAAILFAFIAIFLWIKIYPTIEDPLVENSDEVTILMINKYQDTEMVGSWGVGENKMKSVLQQQVVSVLGKGSTHRVFLVGTHTNQMFGTMYRIELQDGNKHKSIWLGGDRSYVLIGEKTYRYIIDSDIIIAELDALLTAN